VLRAVTFVIATSLLTIGRSAPATQTLTPSRSLPSSVLTSIDRIQTCVETGTGELLILDAGAQTVSLIDAARTTVRKIVATGPEWGHVLRPNALALGRDRTFAVADTPGPYDRVQVFSMTGRLLGQFFPPGAPGTRLSIGPLVINGIGAMEFTGERFLFAAPNTGALMIETDLAGRPIQSIGTLRLTGHEDDRPLHVALNAGLPLVDPTGGFYFVFQTGAPMFQKYDAAGVLVFERHVEGTELDATLRTFPTTWPKRDESQGLLPYAPPTVSSAAVDPDGRLWISLTVPYTYVYDRTGEKIRVVQFQATRPLTPSQLHFPVPDRVVTTPGCYEFRIQLP